MVSPLGQSWVEQGLSLQRTKSGWVFPVYKCRFTLLNAAWWSKPVPHVRVYMYMYLCAELDSRNENFQVIFM